MKSGPGGHRAGMSNRPGPAPDDNPDRPDSRVLVVTGASSGIGRATVLEAQEDGNVLRGDQGSALVGIGQNVLQGLRGRGERGGA